MMISKKKIKNIIKKMPQSLEVVGSVARKEKEINDIDFITKKKIIDVIEEIKKIFKNVKVIRKGSKIARLTINDVSVDIFGYSKPEEKIFIKFARTNKKGENISYRKKAKNKNMLLNDKGLYTLNGERILIKSIIELKRKLNS